MFSFVFFYLHPRKWTKIAGSSNTSQLNDNQNWSFIRSELSHLLWQLTRNKWKRTKGWESHTLHSLAADHHTYATIRNINKYTHADHQHQQRRSTVQSPCWVRTNWWVTDSFVLSEKREVFTAACGESWSGSDDLFDRMKNKMYSDNCREAVEDKHPQTYLFLSI